METGIGKKPRDCILITGSGGLVGKAFLTRFHDRFTEFALDREKPLYPPYMALHVIPCDLSSDESVRTALEETRRQGGGRIASVLHLASPPDFSGEPKGTQRLLRGLRGFEVEQFVFMSTMLVHDSVFPGDLISENDPIDPKGEYPRSKVAAEAIIHRERGRISTVALRAAEVYDDGTHSVPLAQHMRRIYERRFLSHFFPGEFEHGRSFLHMDDLVDALYLTIVRRRVLPPETVLLLGETDVMSFAELQEDLARLIHRRTFWLTFPVPKALARLGAWIRKSLPAKDAAVRSSTIDLADDHFALDISQAKLLLHWEPRRSLRESLPAMVSALKADPEAWYRENAMGVPPR